MTYGRVRTALNLILYSDQIIPSNDKVDQRLIRLLSGRRRIGYIPSGPEADRRFFTEKSSYYAKLDLDLAYFYDPQESGHPGDLNTLLACDAIHLPGGNTAAFLGCLRHSGMVQRLYDWALGGGVLIGTSAGAILMTPTIAVDALFDDAVIEDTPDKAGLDLVPFEFFPHALSRQSYMHDLLDYSRRNSRPIIACPDGDGVIVTSGVVECIGQPLWIANGAVQSAKHVPQA